MAIRTKDEILSQIRERFGTDTSDEVITLIEDITDTVDDLVSKASDTTDWQAKYEENDSAWRARYRDRFFGKQPEDDGDDEPEDKPILSFEDLFKKE